MDQRELRRQIETLERRQNYLGQRIAQRKTSSRKEGSNDESYDRAEFRALETAIKAMEDAFTLLPQTRAKGTTKGNS